MPGGSHRAHRPPRVRRTRAGALALASTVLVGGLGTAVVLLRGPETPPDRAAADADEPGAPAPQTRSPDSGTGPSPTLRPLPEASPRHLTVLAGGEVPLATDFDSARPQTDAPLVTLSSGEVTRLADRGLPGSPGSDTVVIVGDASSGGVWASLPQVEPGNRLLLTTEAGELVYEVVALRSRSPASVLADDWLTEREPGLVVLVGRYAETEADLLVRARLTEASAG
jgi:hypothetical protein